MKLSTTQHRAGFTLAENTIALGVSSIIVLVALTASISLQKSFNAVDNYFATHMQQIRIIDYLNRDVKRGLVVTTSADLQSVTVNVPQYLIQAGDPEAIADPATIGTPRTPTINYTANGLQVNYTATPSTVVYSISGESILRVENGVVTTIATSTDRLVPKSTDTELANTEYSTTNVTFQPLFTNTDTRSGTTVYATAYLRNKRRG